MKLYGCPNSRSLRAAWALEEAAAEYEYVLVDLFTGAARTPEFLALNPAGKLPVLVDGDLKLTESGAIIAYVSDKFPASGLVPRPFPTAKWLVNERQELHPGGFHVAGPYPYTQTAQLEASIESGFDLQYATVCADALKVTMTQLAAGQPASGGKTVPTSYVAPAQRYVARLNVPLCDWALVTYSRSDTVAAVEVIP